MRHLTLALVLACRPDKPAPTDPGDSGTRDDSAAPADPLRDTDGDGTPDSGDCSPGWASIGPNVEEIEGDGLDQNCDGLDRAVTDIRAVATQFWGENPSSFGEDMAIAHVGNTDVALIGQPIVDRAGKIYIIGHPDQPMRHVRVQEEDSTTDDHLGWSMIGAVLDGQPALVAPYDLATGEQFIAAWPLTDLGSDLGPADLLFNHLVTTERYRSAGSPTFGPDLNADGVSDLFLPEYRDEGAILQVWPGPTTSAAVEGVPTFLGLPLGYSDGGRFEVTQSNGALPDFAMVAQVDPDVTGFQFVQGGADAGFIDMRSPSWRPNPHAARPDLDGDGVRERCVADAFWVPDDVETGIVACFPHATGGVLTMAEAHTHLLGELPHSYFGMSFQSADLDGDGRDELVVGAPTTEISNRAGLIYILKEVDGALTIHATLSDFAIHSGFGQVLGVGDLDGDGTPDIVTTEKMACLGGASNADPAATCPGAAWVIPGAAGLW